MFVIILIYYFCRLHGGDNVQVKRYFVSFWNGVDLRYKLLKGPKVRISIAGLIISRVSMLIQSNLFFVETSWVILRKLAYFSKRQISQIPNMLHDLFLCSFEEYISFIFYNC